MGLYGYICAFDPQHPARAHQPAERLRWLELDMSWDRRVSGQWVCEREQRFADDDAVERAIELQEQEWTERGLEICEREVDIAIGCSAREPQLEREIRASEDPKAALEVYAEWLQCQGDPRGIVAALDLARQRAQEPDERERLDRAFREALVEHGCHLFGPHAAHVEHVELEWRGGMVFGLSLDPSESRWPSELFELPLFACLRRLRLAGEPDIHSVQVVTRPGAESLAGLRVLECRLAPMFLDRARDHLPRLEQLECNFIRGALRLPALRRLDLQSPTIYSLRGALTTLRESELPKLDDLTLSVHTFGLHRAPAEILAELLALPVMARLRRFVLLNLRPDGPVWNHDMARALLQAQSLRQIPRVELRLADFDADTGSSLGQQARARPNWYLG